MKIVFLASFLLISGCTSQQIQQSKAVLDVVCEINGVFVTEKVSDSKVQDAMAVAKEVCARKNGVLMAVTVPETGK